jgi:hypothetical protein
VADVAQLMAAVVEPAAEVYWDAVGTIVDSAGEHSFAPETAAEWVAVRNSAYVVAESGNLLLMSGRAFDAGDWVRMSREMIAAGRRALAAAEAQDPDAVFDAGAELYGTCTACHAKYAVGLLRPSATAP